MRTVPQDRHAIITALSRDDVQAATFQEGGHGEDVAEVVIDHEDRLACQIGSR